MKKVYNKPEFELIQMQLVDVLTSSPLGESTPGMSAGVWREDKPWWGV